METEAKQHSSALDVVLLGVFALGLALSLALVKVRSRVILDTPMELPPAGLAVSLPAGTGWETAGGWRYESDNAYVLPGRMRLGERVLVNVRWRYVLCDEPITPEEWLHRRSEAVGGHLMPLGTVPGTVGMQYGRIYGAAGMDEEYLFGAAVLDYGRRLELHVSYLRDDYHAEHVFRTLAGAVVYQRPAAMGHGVDWVQRFYAEGLGHFFESDVRPQTAFLIQDATQRPLGYAVRRYFAHHADEEGHHRLTVRRLEASGLYTESDLWLACDQTLVWTTQMWTPNTSPPRTAQMRSDASGRLVLQTNTDRRRVLWRTPMMLPDIFLAEFAAMLAAAEEDIIIDLLTGEGIVVPTRMGVIDAAQSPVRSEQPVVIVRAEYLHAANNFDDFVFDAEGQLLGRFEQEPRRPGLLWEASSPEQLERIFGDRFEPRARQSVRREHNAHIY